MGAALLVLLGINVILIAEHNQYAGREGVGASIHIYADLGCCDLLASRQTSEQTTRYGRLGSLMDGRFSVF